jgi:5'-deoxynucleotidase YfbR-like HD superfamily hydrolase
MIGLSMDLWYKFKDFDLNKSIYLICIHDIDETVTVDIPRPFKYFSDKFRKLLNKTTHDYLVSEGFDEEFVNDVQSAKSQGKEGKIVSLVDIYQVVKKLKREVALGNSLAKYKLTESNRYLNEMISKNSDLKNYLQYLDSIDELN